MQEVIHYLALQTNILNFLNTGHHNIKFTFEKQVDK